MLGCPAQDLVKSFVRRIVRCALTPKLAHLEAAARIGKLIRCDEMLFCERFGQRPRNYRSKIRILEQGGNARKWGNETSIRAGRSLSDSARSNAARSYISDLRARPRSEMKPSIAPSCSPPKETTTIGSCAKVALSSLSSLRSLPTMMTSSYANRRLDRKRLGGAEKTPLATSMRQSLSVLPSRCE
jgi:hypothetical protein